MSNFIYTLSRWLAWFGGLILITLAVLSTASIIGRALSGTGLGLGPVPGDFELVEAGTALAVFCFLPWCYLRNAHATVDLFWSLYPAPVRRFLLISNDVLMLIIWTLLIWRMGVGTMSYHESGDTTFILQMPVWWGYAASMLPGAIGVCAYAVRLLERIGLIASSDNTLLEDIG